ncbi:MAG: group I truncated hemoglobin, partial [Asticcacaulis sp.]
MKMILKTSAILLAAMAATPVLAEQPVPPNAPVVSPDGSLYRAFGGHDGVVKIMDDLFVNIEVDPRIKPFFEPAKIPHIKEMLVLQVCAITGGGCTYTGKDMAKVHAQLGIQPSDFNAL